MIKYAAIEASDEYFSTLMPQRLTVGLELILQSPASAATQASDVMLMALILQKRGGFGFLV